MLIDTAFLWSGEKTVNVSLCVFNAEIDIYVGYDISHLVKETALV